MSEPRCVKFSQLDELLREQDRRLPLAISADLTYRCNFRCAHCFCRLPEEAPQAARELTFDEWDRILGEGVEEGALFLTLTGGEALLHPDFRRLWVAAKRRGLLVTLFTNGALLTADWADFFADWPPQEISVSLYGATEETYRNFTGLPGMYRRVRDALDRLVERGLPLEVKSVFTRRNVHEFAALRQLILQYGSIFRWDAELLGSYAEGGDSPATERLSAEEIIALEGADPGRDGEWRRRLQDWHPSPPLSDSPFRCGVGGGGPHFDPYGQMRPCMTLESVSYDARTGSVREGWREVLPRLLAAVPVAPGPCVSCGLPQLCRFCPAQARLDGCSVGGPSPLHCELARLRARAYDVPVERTVISHTVGDAQVAGRTRRLGGESNDTKEGGRLERMDQAGDHASNPRA
jgi:MoaA/NifB/PqqE/SkfB family radical SAM enzyme